MLKQWAAKPKVWTPKAAAELDRSLERTSPPRIWCVSHDHTSRNPSWLTRICTGIPRLHLIPVARRAHPEPLFLSLLLLCLTTPYVLPPRKVASSCRSQEQHHHHGDSRGASDGTQKQGQQGLFGPQLAICDRLLQQGHRAARQGPCVLVQPSPSAH